MESKVFVSSTYADLKDTREFIYSELKRSMLKPILFEKGGVSFNPDTPLDESCYKRVTECQLYILIIGSRYGSKASQHAIADDSSCDFNSVTRKEWEEAKKNEIPINIFVKDEVLTEYEIYKEQNSATYKCVTVDNINVFKLIEDIYSQSINNYLCRYKTPKDIIESFLKQSSGLLKRLLDERQSNISVTVSKREYPVDCYKLYFYRSKRNLTQKQLSVYANCNLRWLNKIESEKRNSSGFHKASIKEIELLENALNLDAGELVGSSSPYADGKYKSFYYKNKKKRATFDSFLDVDKKVAVFDFDGTLTIQDNGHTTWEKLWIELGYPENECFKYHKQFTSGQIDHNEWCEITTQKFNDKNVSKQTLINVAKKIELLAGTKELFTKLYSRGVTIYILSGSIEFIIKEVLGDCLKYVKEISSNEMEFNEEKLSRIIGTEYDFEGKADYIKKKIEYHRVPPNEVLFVGNSNNDIHAFESNAVTLLINPVHVNPYSKCWTYNENLINDLQDIEKYIFPSDH